MQDSNHNVHRPLRSPINAEPISSNLSDSQHGALAPQLSLPQQTQFLQLIRIGLIFGFVVIILLTSYVCYLDNQVDRLKSVTSLSDEQYRVNYKLVDEKVNNLTTVSHHLSQDLLKNSLQAYKGLNQISNLYSKAKKDKLQI